MMIKKLLNAFISHPPEYYKFKIGSVLASGLSSFIAGMIVASFIWYAAYYIKNYF